MKKNFKYYIIAWALLLVVFNAISIIMPGWPTLQKRRCLFGSDTLL